MGVCDADYNFLFVDIGGSGRRGDGGVFKDSVLGKKLHGKKMNLPDPTKLTPDGSLLPY